MSVDDSQITAVGICFTLTVRDCPDGHDEWARLTRALLHWLRRRKCCAFHWVTEWQARGVPHLHGIALFRPEDFDAFYQAYLPSYWCDITQHLGTRTAGQHVDFLKGLEGWKRYVSKHAGRGYAHYQRARNDLPFGWYKTGRMWGKGGEWPTVEASVDLTKAQWFVFRRGVRAALISEARRDLAQANRYPDKERQRAALRRLVYVRQMLKRHDRQKSAVRGLNEWLPEAVTRRLLAFAASSRPFGGPCPANVACGASEPAAGATVAKADQTGGAGACKGPQDRRLALAGP